MPLDTFNCPPPVSHGTIVCALSFMLSTAQRHTHIQEPAMWCAVEQRRIQSSQVRTKERESTLIKYAWHNEQTQTHSTSTHRRVADQSVSHPIGALTDPLPHHSLSASKTKQMTQQCFEFRLLVHKPYPTTSCAPEMTLGIVCLQRR